MGFPAHGLRLRIYAMIALMSSIGSVWPKAGMRPGEPVAIRDIRESLSWGSSMSCGARPVLRPPFSWHHPQPFAIKAWEPRSICAAVSPAAAGAGVGSAQLAGAEPQTQAATKAPKLAVRQKPIRRFMLFTNRGGPRIGLDVPAGVSLRAASPNTDPISQMRAIASWFRLEIEFDHGEPRRDAPGTIRPCRR